MKRDLERELKVLEIAEREANGTICLLRLQPMLVSLKRKLLV